MDHLSGYQPHAVNASGKAIGKVAVLTGFPDADSAFR